MEKTKAGPARASDAELSRPTRSNRVVIVVAALDMSWRLAIIVLVPIIAGFELDKHFGTAPALTAVGFVVAMAGTFFILKRTLETADKKFNTGVKR